MKRCPTCKRTFTDPNLSFCIDDGTPLVNVVDSEDVTVVSPSASRTSDDLAPPTQSYTPRDWNSPEYQPPGTYVPPGATGKRRRVWPWVVGIAGALLLGLIGLGIVAAVVLPRMLQSARNQPSYSPPSGSNDNAESLLNSNENANANSNANNNNSNSNNSNSNSNSTDELTPAPTDETEVLAALTSLEHDWTVANINADKKALDRILADDFVGSGPDGKATGKAEYLRTIERDTTTQSWDFQDLKLSLNGTRATLTGIVVFHAGDQQISFNFVDKFVWRDARWQAIGSEVTRI